MEFLNHSTLKQQIISKTAKKRVFLMFASFLFGLVVFNGVAQLGGGLPGQMAQAEESNPRYYWHEVTGVVDGDTVKARVDGKEETIRVMGVDAPEPNQNECFGSESSGKIGEFLGGKWIQLEKDGDTDRDGQDRLLRYVWFDEGTDFGRRMVEEGYAYGVDWSDHHKQDQYKETQDYAKSKSHGLWSVNTCGGKKQKPAESSARQSARPTNPKPAPAPRPAAPAPKPRPAPASGGSVKKSRTGICHAPGTTYYNQTKHFTPYGSLQACLDSGGRMPKR